jgi:hypothetical protein
MPKGVVLTLQLFFRSLPKGEKNMATGLLSDLPWASDHSVAGSINGPYCLSAGTLVDDLRRDGGRWVFRAKIGDDWGTYSTHNEPQIGDVTELRAKQREPIAITPPAGATHFIVCTKIYDGGRFAGVDLRLTEKCWPTYRNPFYANERLVAIMALRLDSREVIDDHKLDGEVLGVLATDYDKDGDFRPDVRNFPFLDGFAVGTAVKGGHATRWL